MRTNTCTGLGDLILLRSSHRPMRRGAPSRHYGKAVADIASMLGQVPARGRLPYIHINIGVVAAL
jgi:hypothetical protein